MIAESSASNLFRKFMGNETNCSANQMARKPMNVNKNNYIAKNVHIKTILADETRCPSTANHTTFNSQIQPPQPLLHDWVLSWFHFKTFPFYFYASRLW